MAASSTLDESERELIARCRKALGTMPQLVSVARIIFWLSFAGGVLAGLALLGLFLTKGSEAVSAREAERLAGGWLWIGLWWIAARTLRSEERLVRLVCKLANDQSAAQSYPSKAES